ncbi:MAG: hypothetical protein ABIA93_03405 [Candidatus Woesearchaeota archaeon]
METRRAIVLERIGRKTIESFVITIVATLLFLLFAHFLLPWAVKLFVMMTPSSAVVNSGDTNLFGTWMVQSAQSVSFLVSPTDSVST